MRRNKIKSLLVIVILVMTTSSSATQVYDYWFDECTWNGTTGEVLDYSGNANDATAKNGLNTINTEKVIDRGVYFDGIDDYIDTGKNLTILQYESASLSFWIKTTQAGNNTTWQAPGITGAEQVGTTDDMYWGYLDATGRIGLSVGDTNMVQSTSPINDNFWHHIVLTRDAKTNIGKVYVDGVLEGSGVLNARATFLEFRSIGRSEGAGYLQGYLDEVEMYDDILSETQIGIIYANQVAGKNYDGTTRPATYNCQGPIPYPNNYIWGATVSGNLLTDGVDGSDARVDMDPNSNPITIHTYTQPPHGTVVVNPDGSFIYTADLGYVGPDIFTYTIINSNGDISNRYSNVNLSATVANDDGFTTTQNNSTSGNVLENDVYPVGSTISTDTAGLNGVLSINSTTGAFTFTPTSGFSGMTSFTYMLDDGNGNTSTATVRFTVEVPIVLPVNLVAEYRMDECGFDHTTKDVIDNSINCLHGTSFADTAIGAGNTLCSAASFDSTDDYISVPNDAKLNITTNMTISFWVYPTRDNTDEYYVSKRAANTGWYVWFNNRVFGSTDRIEFQIYSGGSWRSTTINKPTSWLNQWHLITATFDGTTMRLYIKDAINNLTENTARSGTITISTNPMLFAQYNTGTYFFGKLDEVKVFNTTLSATEISALYTNESAGRNWNETTDTRVCNACQCTAKAGSNLVSFPADFRNMVSGKDVTTMLGTHFTGVYGEDWELARRDYDIVTDNKNNAYYTPLLDSDVLQYGKAYWIANRTGTDINYTANLKTMDFNSTVTAYPGCRSANGKCALIDLVEPNGTDNKGPYIYTMTSFAVQKPIRWEDVRVLITDGGQTISYTPDQAAALEETFNATIWRYDQDGTNYTNVTTGTPGLDNTIDPCSGYWIELDKNTAGKTVQLLIPEE